MTEPTDAVRPPWPHFPHCPGCHRRLWSKTARRFDDPRGPLTSPTPHGRCPHCSTLLRTEPR